MLIARLIRHAESAANAGHASDDPALIPLTDTGAAQARLIAGSFSDAPDLIVTSPYARAQATALPTIQAYPHAETATWPVQEFTYLAPGRCVNTTQRMRRAWVADYWELADPDRQDGEGAETFRAFMGRAQAFLEALHQQNRARVAVFSHGQLINAVAWLIERKPARIDRRAMRDYRQYELAHPVANGWGYHLLKDKGQHTWRLGNQVNPQGALCRNSAPLPVCGTMLLYAGKLGAPLDLP